MRIFHLILVYQRATNLASELIYYKQHPVKLHMLVLCVIGIIGLLLLLNFNRIHYFLILLNNISYYSIIKKC